MSDDAAFISVLRQAEIPYLPPALVLVELVHQRQLERRAAMDGMERMRPFIR